MELWDDLWAGGSNDFVPKAIQLLKSAGISKADIDDLYERFLPADCRPQCSLQDVWAIMCLVADGVYLMDRQPPYKPTVAAQSILIPMKSHRETETHHRLKQEATEWLNLKVGIKRVLYEEAFGSGVCDVMSDCRKWIVECGASRPSKIWDFYRLEGVSDTSIVLFNDHGVTSFKAGPNLPGYLSLKREGDATFHKKMDEFSQLVMGNKSPVIRRKKPNKPPTSL